MTRHQPTAAQAFGTILRCSQDRCLELREVAGGINRIGDLLA